jgi:hypothetical protein
MWWSRLPACTDARCGCACCCRLCTSLVGHRMITNALMLLAVLGGLSAAVLAWTLWPVTLAAPFSLHPPLMTLGVRRPRHAVDSAHAD